MIFFIFPLIWAAVWGVASVFISAAFGITPDNAMVWWYIAGIFVCGAIVLPVIVIVIALATLKARNKKRRREQTDTAKK